MTRTTGQGGNRVDNWGVPPVRVRLNASFDELVKMNPDQQFEQLSNGEVIVMTPTGGESGYRNSILIAQLVNWSTSHGGRVFDSSTLFQLPNGARRSPDASWINADRWRELTASQRKGFPPLCPDLVIELRSESDRLVDLLEKMNEYQRNGAQVGWLIDPLLHQVHVYRLGREVEILKCPSSLADDDVLPGFVMDLSKIWREG